MKTFGKLAIAASVLLLIGGTVTAAGAVIAYKNEEGAVTERVEKHYVAEGAASALKVKTYSGSVNVVKGDVETIKIDYKDKEDDPQVEFTFVDGVLEMKEKEKQWFNWVGEFVWPWNYDKIFDNVTTITVPMDSDIDYKIAATSGSIYVENATSSKDLIIDCTSGSVTVKNCNIGGKVDLGPLPATSIALLAGLAVIWLLIGCYMLTGYIKKRKTARSRLHLWQSRPPQSRCREIDRHPCGLWLHQSLCHRC